MMKRTLYIFISVLLILSASLLTACKEAAPEKTQKKTVETQAASGSELQQRLEKKMQQYRFSGVCRVSKNGKVLCEGANGTLSPDSDQPITLDNQFPIASISKQFCATCVLLLREEGKLDLDETLDKYYPEYSRAKDITLKNMLILHLSFCRNTIILQLIWIFFFDSQHEMYLLTNSSLISIITFVVV